MSVNRRELFPILAAGLTVAELEAQHIHGTATPLVATDDYPLRFFTKEQHRLLDALAEWIIPADGQSGGAHQAHVANYIDLVTSYASPAMQQRWRDGLAGVAALAAAQYGKPFGQCSKDQQEAMLKSMAEKEEDPTEFFVLLKSATVDGYRLSPVGMKEWMGWQGHPGGLYPGCDHPGEH